MRSFVTPILIGAVLGCSPAMRLDMETTAYNSRSAAIIQYDDGYARNLVTLSVDLRKRAQTGSVPDQISLLFALDELAEIYAYRLVNFEKAKSTNDEVEELLAVIGQRTEPYLYGKFFSRHRRLYAFIILPAFGEVPAEYSVNSDALLMFVAQQDKQRVASRARERRIFLEQAVDTSSDERTRKQAPSERVFESGKQEIEAWKAVFGEGLRGREYDRVLAELDRIWLLREHMEYQDWLRMVDTTARTALLLEVGEPDSHARDRALVRYRAGIASVSLGRVAEGVHRFEETLQALQRYDETQKTRYDEISRQRKLGRVLGYFTFPGGGLTLPLGLIFSEWAYQADMTRLEELFGEGFHGLKGFLNEHERLAFHHDLGYGYERLGRRKEAIEQYKAAIEIIEKQRATIGGEEKRIQFLKDKEGVYKRLIPLLIEEGDPNGAFEYMERARSRAFVDMLATGRPKFGTQEEAAQYQATIRALAEVQVLVQEGGLPRETAEQFHKKLRGVEGNQPAHKSTTPEFDSLAAVQTASMKEIGQVLGKDAALLSFFVGDDKTTVMVLQDGQVSGWVKPLGRAALVERVGELRRLIEAPDQKKAKEGDIKEIERLGQALYRDLLEDVAKVIKKPVVYVVPHGPLHYLPFAAIHDGAKYMVDRFTLLTVPSGTVLTYLEKKQSATKGATVVFANPDLGDPRMDLPFAEREGKAIQARRSDAVLLKRNGAMEARARKLAPGASRLHFAAHSTFDADRPLNSAVMLASGEGDDGALTAGEIFGLRLPGSLVVLSGCETGMGKVASGDELIGLTRAFMYAGAPQLVATLWQVEDEATAMLMEDFYKGMSAKPAAEALRQAQTSIRSRYPHPFYWAAFTTFGHHR